MEGSKTLFRSSKPPWGPERIPSTSTDNLDMRPQKGSPGMAYSSVSQTVVRGPQMVLGFCPCGHLRLNISPKKTDKIKLTRIAYHTL
jgi:hypothetical protein